ncbi:bax inhibitor 1-like [Lycium ferocissimum]|uniref:bax inhibitor 1-like n=1 Tax=Lycium ferocissimum TaxID=112874 RepID=UPI002815987C|nr:bax inhibitor 1-like [Lycium ferocissimum]
MKLNAMKAYFKRNWNKEDMLNSFEIPLHAHKNLTKVYLTLFCATLSATFGSFLHLIWEAGDLYTVLTSVTCSLWIYFIKPWKVKRRVFLLMIAAFSFGASLGIFTKYFFEIDQGFVVNLLAGTAIGYGTFWFEAKSTRERSTLYVGCLLHSYVFMYMWFVTAAEMIFGGHTAHYLIKVLVVLALFMAYFVICSQEIVYNALSEDVNFVNCIFTVFFNLPAIVVHIVQLQLIEVIEHFGQS